jgi:urea carboxylase-associated protein 2
MATVASAERLLPGGASWSHVLERGHALDVEDVEGGANAALLLLNAREPSERLNVPDTLKAQHVARITSGVALYSDMGRVLASVIEDSCGWHDPIAGHARTAELEERFGPSSFAVHGNDVRRGAREELVLELAKHGLGVRDLGATISLFSKVTVDADGRLRFHPGHSAPGSRLVLRADMDVLVVLNSGPHPLDEHPTWQPRPLRLTLREVGPAAAGDAVRLACAENERGFAATDAAHL